MNILRKRINCKDLFISKEHPKFIIDKKYEYKNNNFSEDEIKEISIFSNFFFLAGYIVY